MKSLWVFGIIQIFYFIIRIAFYTFDMLLCFFDFLHSEIPSIKRIFFRSLSFSETNNETKIYI